MLTLAIKTSVITIYAFCLTKPVIHINATERLRQLSI